MSLISQGATLLRLLDESFMEALTEVAAVVESAVATR